jgi:demethylmenaquinone methyltransferase/2-methoxy-6-polyprenyl-1,4-benzoquinol methylase
MSGFEHFDFLAPFYERVIRGKISDELRAHIALLPGCLLLDAGGGTGRIAGAIQSEGARVIVADSSLAMLRQAHLKTGLSPACTNTEDLPFLNDTFDRVIMIDALHHVRDQHQSVSEMLRVLKPGGRLVIEEPDIETGVVKWIAVAEKIAGMRSHFLSGAKIKALADRGMGHISVEQKNHTVWVTIHKV